MPYFMTIAEGASLAGLEGLISGIKSAIAWIYTLFATVVTTITTNDLLLYPVLFALVMGAVALVIKIVRKFGMRSRRS